MPPFRPLKIPPAAKRGQSTSLLVCKIWDADSARFAASAERCGEIEKASALPIICRSRHTHTATLNIQAEWNMMEMERMTKQILRLYAWRQHTPATLTHKNNAQIWKVPSSLQWSAIFFSWWVSVLKCSGYLSADSKQIIEMVLLSKTKLEFYIWLDIISNFVLCCAFILTFC